MKTFKTNQMISWLYSGIAAMGMFNVLPVSGQTNSNNQGVPTPIHESQAESLDQWLNQGSSEFVRKLQKESRGGARVSSRGASSENAIQDQIDAADAGSIVTISSGTYRGRVIVNKALTIVGSGDVTLLPPDDDSTGALLTITSSDVTLRNLNVTGSRGGGINGSGIYINGTDLSNISLEDVSSSQNSGNGVYVRVNGSVNNIEFNRFKAELNELGGVWFGKGAAGANGGYRVDTINFLGDGSTPNFSQNGTTGVSIRMFNGSNDEFDFIGPIKFDEVVFEANYGVGQVVIEGPTAEVDFLGCRFHGGPDLDFNLNDPLPDQADFSQYGVVIFGDEDPANYKSIPPVRFLSKNNKANTFDGIYWFGAINFIGWNDLVNVSLGGTLSTGVDISALMRGGSIGYWFGFVKASGADGTLDLEGLKLSHIRVGTYDLIMGANPFDPNLENGTHKKSTLNVDASKVVYEMIDGSEKTFDEMGIDEKFKAAALYLSRLNPFYLNETPGGLVRLATDPNEYYYVPNEGVDLAEIIDETPDGSRIFVQRGTYKLSASFTLNPANTYYFQGGVDPLGVNVPFSFRPNGATYFDFDTDTSPGLATIFGKVFVGEQTNERLRRGVAVYLDENNNGSLDAWEDSSVTDSNGEFRLPYNGAIPADGNSVNVVLRAELPANGINSSWGFLSPSDGKLDFEITNFSPGDLLGDNKFVLEFNLSGIEIGIAVDRNLNSILDDFESSTSVSVGSYNLILYRNDGPNGDKVEVSRFTTLEELKQYDFDLGSYVLELDELEMVNPAKFSISTSTQSVSAIILTADWFEGAWIGRLFEDLNGNGEKESDEPQVDLDGKWIDWVRVLSYWGDTSAVGQNDSFEDFARLVDLAKVADSGFALEFFTEGRYGQTEVWSVSNPVGAGAFIQYPEKVYFSNGDDVERLLLGDVTGLFYEQVYKESLDQRAIRSLRGIAKDGWGHSDATSIDSPDTYWIGYFTKPTLSGVVGAKTGDTFTEVFSGALVFLKNSDDGSIVEIQTTNSLGEFQFTDVSPGSYSLDIQGGPTSNLGVTIPDLAPIQSGVNQTGIEIVFQLNQAPVIEDQSINPIRELQPVDAVVGTVVATDPEDQTLAYSILDGNFVDSPELSAYRFRSRFTEMGLTPGLKLESSFASSSKLIFGISRATQQVEYFWILPNGKIYLPVVQTGTANVLTRINLDSLGAVQAELSSAFFTTPRNLFNFTTEPEFVTPFSIDSATGELTVAVAGVAVGDQPDGGFRLLVEVEDEFGATDQGTVTIELEPANLAPVFADESPVRTLGESAQVGQLIGAPINATDPDGNDLTYSIVSVSKLEDELKALDTQHEFIDPSGGEFSFNSRGQNEKWLYGSTSGSWFYLLQNVSTQIIELYQASLDTNRNYQLAASGQEPLLKLPPAFYDNPGLILGIRNQAPAASFIAIDSETGQLSVSALSDAFNPQLNTSFDVVVRVVDSPDAPGLPFTDEVTVQVNINAVFGSPVVENQSFSLAENSDPDTVVGTIAATDPEGAADIVRYEIRNGNAPVSGSAAPFAINATTGELTVNSSADLDFEETPSFNLTVRVTDSTLRWAEALITVNLTDVNEDIPVTIGDALAIESNPGGSSNLEFPIRIEFAVSENVELSYTINEGTASSTDWVDSSGGTVVIPANSTEATLQIGINPDTLAEGDESFSVVIALGNSVENVVIQENTGTGTILDDDRSIVLDYGPSSPSDVFSTALKNSLNATSLDLDFLNTYLDPIDATLYFSAVDSDTSVSDSYFVNDTDNGGVSLDYLLPSLTKLAPIYSEVEGFNLPGVSSGQAYRVSVSAPFETTSAIETLLAQSEFVVTASGVSTKLNVPYYYYSNGGGTDFATNADGSVIVDPSTGSDAIVYWHDLGTFTAGSNGLNIALSSKLIVDANGANLAQIADAVRIEPIADSVIVVAAADPNDVAYNETAEIQVTLSEAPATGSSVKVAYQVLNDNGALQGGGSLTGNIEFAAGETQKVVSIPAATSAAPSQEPTRSYSVILGPVLEGMATITDHRLEGEVLPAVFDIPRASLTGLSSAVESAGSLTFNAVLDRSAPELIQMQYRAIGISGGGFTNQVGTLSFAQGSTSASFSISFADDLVQNTTARQFRVQLVSGPQFSLGNSSVTVTLEDDEAPILLDAPGSGLFAEKEFILNAPKWNTVQSGFGGQSRTILGVGRFSDAQVAAEWQIDGLETGKTYQILTTWKEGPNLSDDAPFKALVENPTSGEKEIIGERRIDQSVAPSDFFTDTAGQFINNGNLGWSEIGIFTAEESTWWVQLWNDASGFVVADAIRVEEVEPPLITAIADLDMNAGETLEIPVQLGHLDPLRDLSKVSIIGVTSSSELLIPNNPKDGAGISFSASNAAAGQWVVQLTSIGLRSGSAQITVEVEDDTSLKVTDTFSVNVTRSKVLFDFGTVTQALEDQLADQAIAVSKNTLYNVNTLYGWEENVGLQGKSFPNLSSNVLLIDSVIGPVNGVFKIGGLQTNTDYLIAAQLGRIVSGSAGTGIEVINLNNPDGIGAKATHYYNRSDSTYSSDSDVVEKNIISRSDSNGEIRLAIRPFTPNPEATANPYFAISGIEFSVLDSSNTGNLNNLNIDSENSSQPNQWLISRNSISSRANNNGVSPVAAPAWIDNGDAAFSTVGDWVLVDGQGVERDILYNINQSTDSRASWTFSNLASGSYRLAVTWPEGSNRATNSSWTVTHQGETFGPFTLDQTQSPGETTFNGITWDYLTNREWRVAFDSVLPGLNDEDGALIPLTYNDFVVELSGSSSGFVIADAVRLEPISDALLLAETPSTFTQLEGNAISGEARIPVSLNTEPLSIASLSFEIVAESATALSDFAPVEGTLTFIPGQTEAELLIPIFGDTNVEPNETFLVRWTDPNGLALSNTETRVIIVNDDGGVSTAPTETQISVKSGIVEGATVFLDANGNGVFDGAEVFAVTDSTGLASFVSFASQAQGGAVAQGGVDRVTGDPMTLTLSAPQGASVVHSLTTILNWKLDQNPEAVSSTVKDDLLGSFGIGADYRLLTQNPIARYRATFSANNARALVAQFGMETVAQALVAYMNAAGDTVTSGDVFEGLASGLSGVFDWNSVADWEGLIQSVETSTGVGINDGHATVIAEAMAELSGKAQVVLVDSSPALSSARLEALSDLAQLRAYVRRVMVRDLADLGSGTINAEQWTGDNSGAFLTEAIASQITNRSVGTAQVPGALALSRLDYSLFESEGRVGIEVVRSRGALGTVGATLVVKEGTATFENDLVEATSAIEFGFGETGTKTFFVNVQNDVFEESDEMFSIELVDPVGGAALDLPGLASVMIEDDDSVEILQTIELVVSMNAAIHEVFLTWPSFLQGIVELESKSELSAQEPWEVVDISTAADSAGFTTLAVDTVGQLDRVYRLKISIPLQSLQLRNGSLELVTSREAAESLVLEAQAAGSAEWVEVPLEDVWEDPVTGQTIIPAPVNEGGTKYRLRALK